jgi:hypothetical protein
MRNALIVLGILWSAACTGYSQTTPSAGCLAGVTPAPPTFSLSSTLGAVSDYTLFCTNTGFSGAPVASLNFDFFLNGSLLTTGPWMLTQGLNTYSGSLILSNAVQFLGVSYDPNQPTLSFEIHGMEVNPSTFPGGFVYEETSTIAGALSVGITNPVQTVARNANAPEPSTILLVGLVHVLAINVVRQRKPYLPTFRGNVKY